MGSLFKGRNNLDQDANECQCQGQFVLLNFLTTVHNTTVQNYGMKLLFIFLTKHFINSLPPSLSLSKHAWFLILPLLLLLGIIATHHNFILRRHINLNTNSSNQPNPRITKPHLRSGLLSGDQFHMVLRRMVQQHHRRQNRSMGGQ